jgi:hypothetical protein
MGCDENDVKQNKEHYKSPLLFYVKNGFVICKKMRLKIRKYRRSNKLEALTKKYKISNPKSENSF